VEIAFKPSLFLKVAAVIGIPLLLVLGIGFVAAALFALTQLDTDEDALMVFAAGISLGGFMLWIGALGIRSWQSFFKNYVLAEGGVTIFWRSGTTLLPWRNLTDARWRRAPQMLELTFQDAASRIILMNIDTDPSQARLKAAMELLENCAPVSIRKTVL
jgi:hypothetical protein